MVIFGKWKNATLTLSLKNNSLTISLQSKTDSQVYSFDGMGRLWTAMWGGISYRRGLNGRTVAKWQTAADGPLSVGSLQSTARDRRWLDEKEAAALEEQARRTAASLLDDLRGGQVETNAPLNERDLVFMENASGFTQARYQQDVQQYLNVYKPVGILPPDQYMAVVLQATEGCSFNTCTFCTFYRDRRFHIRRKDDFRAHAQAVRDYLGEGIHLRRTIFLGDANALVVPMPRLLELIDVVHEVYDVERLGGIYAFLDGFSGEKKTAADYRTLAERGVKRIYVGMESGNADLLRFLKKPGNPDDAVQAVKAIKAGGISVGIIILLGAGGKTYARAHVEDTVAALNALPLDIDDLIYFSELIESEGMEYTRDAYQQQFQPLTSQERIAQGEEIERRLKFSKRGGVPHISRYDIREFVY